MAYYDNIFLTPVAPPETATVSQKATDYTISPTESGTYFELSGASANTEFTLPEEPTPGFVCAFFNATTFRLTITAQGDDRILYKAAGSQRSIYQALRTTSAHLYYLGSNQWFVMGYGTWTGVAP